MVPALVVGAPAFSTRAGQESAPCQNSESMTPETTPRDLKALLNQRERDLLFWNEQWGGVSPLLSSSTHCCLNAWYAKGSDEPALSLFRLGRGGLQRQAFHRIFYCIAGLFGNPEAGRKDSLELQGGRGWQGDSAAVRNPGNARPTPTSRAAPPPPRTNRLGAHALYTPRAAKQDFCAGVKDHKQRRNFRLSSDPLDGECRRLGGRGTV